MRFFKYLILFLSTFFSSAYTFSNTVTEYYINYLGTVYTGFTNTEACNSALPAFRSQKLQEGYVDTVFLRIDRSNCLYSSQRPNGTFSNYTLQFFTRQVTAQCWYPDHKIITQPITGQIKSSVCLQINGVMCKYVEDPQTLKNEPVINGNITTVFESVSKTPDPNCQEELLNPPCDPKDPYGGCFQPADDGCTRQFDGSILCPDEVEPPIERGCNGADYCTRPPQGCGEGYVSGKYNGERICIKTKPSMGGGSDGGGSDGGGSDGGGSDGGGSDGGGSDGGGDLPITPDLAGVINAIKNIASKIDHYSKESIESIDSMSNKITGKQDTSNDHLDGIESNTLATKNNTDQTNDLLQQILDKTGSSGGGSGDPDAVQDVDLTETNDLLGEIRDGIEDIKEVFDDEGKSQLEQIGKESNDARYTSAQTRAQSSLNNLANKLTFGSSACVSDFEIQLPIFGSINIALSQWCSLLALIKILFQLVVLLTCLRMLDATVRTI